MYAFFIRGYRGFWFYSDTVRPTDETTAIEKIICYLLLPREGQHTAPHWLRREVPGLVRRQNETRGKRDRSAWAFQGKEWVRQGRYDEQVYD